MDLLVNVDVHDLAAAERFYCTGLGLVVGRRFGAWGVELRGASVPSYLLQKEGGSLADPFRNGFCFVQFLGREYDEIAD